MTIRLTVAAKKNNGPLDAGNSLFLLADKKTKFSEYGLSEKEQDHLKKEN